MRRDNPVVKAFGDAAGEVLKTMAMLDLRIETVEPVTDAAEAMEISATMGLVGASEGSLLVSLSRPLCLKIVSAMLGLDEDEVEDGDLLDSAAELANMVAGSAKTSLIDTDHAFDLTIPSAMAGEKLSIRPKTGLSGVILRCCVDSDPMTIALWSQDLGE